MSRNKTDNTMMTFCYYNDWHDRHIILSWRTYKIIHDIWLLKIITQSRIQNLTEHEYNEYKEEENEKREENSIKHM
jgi:hypothetical protein